jgi:hypothetical protein
MMALQLTGNSPLIFYSVQFFTWAGASTSPQVSSISVAAITLVTVMAVLLLAADASRRTMMLASQAGVSACLFVLAGYFLADSLDSAESIRWLPLLILILYFIFFNIGLSSFIWTITAEILPSGIRGQMIPLAILVSNAIWFLVTFFLKAMFDAMGGIFIFLFYGVWQGGGGAEGCKWGRNNGRCGKSGAAAGRPSVPPRPPSSGLLNHSEQSRVVVLCGKV